MIIKAVITQEILKSVPKATDIPDLIDTMICNFAGVGSQKTMSVTFKLTKGRDSYDYAEGKHNSELK
jgi:hypothetical protein